MRAAQAFSIIALVGTALAAPWSDWNNQPAEGQNLDNKQDNKPADKHYGGDQDAVVYVTKTVTVKGQKPADATPAPQAQQQSWAPAAQSTWAAAKPSSAPIADDGSWGSVVDTWRAKMQLPAMAQSSQLQGNALKTAQDGNGQMVHQLNPGTMGQVLAPGQPDEFVKVFVGGWLCEMPDAPGMDGICNTMSAGWAYGGETGHAEILRGSYKNIGCACATGIWACDVS